MATAAIFGSPVLNHLPPKAAGDAAAEPAAAAAAPAAAAAVVFDVAHPIPCGGASQLLRLATGRAVVTNGYSRRMFC